MKTLKKTLSLILAVCILASMAVIATVSVSANAGDAVRRYDVTQVVNADPEKQVKTKTYYFYMPTEWRNKYNDSFDGTDLASCTAGIYWWDGSYNCSDYQGTQPNAWPGYGVKETEAADANIFKAAVPEDVPKIIWNNLVDGGEDKTAEVYTAAIQSQDIGSESYDPNEDGYGFYPNGVENFDGMIFICNPKAIGESPLSHKLTYNGVWCYYYGNGEYGIYATRDEAAANNAVLKGGQFPAYGLDIDTKSTTIEVGKEDSITPNDSGAVATISDPSVASITQDASTGKVTVKGLKAGTAKITFTLTKDGSVETVDCDVTVKASKKPNTLKVKATNKTYKAKALKKKAQSYKAISVSKAQGKVSYSVTKKNAKLKFKNGKITVKKGTKKGTYKITVKVTAAGNASYLSKSISKTVKVTVKK